MTDEEKQKIIELIGTIAFYEVNKAVSEGKVTVEMANNEVFMEGVIFGISTTRKRYRQMEDIGNVMAKILLQALDEEKRQSERN